MRRKRGFPLDLQQRDYPYLERPNSVLLALLQRHVLARIDAPRILDVGCGAGANARRLRDLSTDAVLTGIEPSPHAAELAAASYDELLCGSVEQWLERPPTDRFDAVILSDVVEHVPDPVGLLRRLARTPALGAAHWFVSVPNYAVWYNRLRTLAGRFDYAESGLYDRTHLRFFTRRSLRRTLEHCELDVIDERCTPSLVQSSAPWLRLLYERPLEQGRTLALGGSSLFRTYQRWVEPLEIGLCQLWPELLGFQIVAVARVRAGGEGRDSP